MVHDKYIVDYISSCCTIEGDKPERFIPMSNEQSHKWT